MPRQRRASRDGQQQQLADCSLQTSPSLWSYTPTWSRSPTIRSYAGAVVAWGMATPQDERTWSKFVTNFPTVIGGPLPKVKLQL